jgi:long-chain acyl-CoA synthetase
MDKKGNIFIRGRIKSMFLGASGQNIYPEEIEDKLNNQMGVAESIVVEREGKLIGLVFPDEEATKGFSLAEVERMMKDNLKKLNELLPSYSRVHDIEVKHEPFEKTPKKSIKRFLYK